jgi:hypothetical protein
MHYGVHMEDNLCLLCNTTAGKDSLLRCTIAGIVLISWLIIIIQDILNSRLRLLYLSALYSLV